MTETHVLRAATEGDYPWLLRFLPQLQTPDPLPSPELFRAQFLPRLHMFDPRPGGDPIGCAILDPLEDTVYVRVIVIDELARGQGAGLSLMRAIATWMRAEGRSRWCLNVKVDNAAAIALYERVGMRRAYESHALALAWDKVDALEVTHEIISSGEILPAMDASVEREWELPAGQLAHWRAMPGQHLRGLFDADGRCVGLARANPAHPGMFPFRLRRAAHARALIESARPLFDERKPVGLVIEDDEPLAAMLLAQGAERRMHLQHMRGSLADAR